MANEKKISDLTPITDPDDLDMFVVVDESEKDGADAGAKGKTSHITFENLKTAMGGLQGVAGEQGIQGEPGEDGADGEQGIQGPAGPAGANGADGPAGDKGAPGDQGDKGDTGEDGTSMKIVGEVPSWQTLQDPNENNSKAINKTSEKFTNKNTRRSLFSCFFCGSCCINSRLKDKN